MRRWIAGLLAGTVLLTCSGCRLRDSAVSTITGDVSTDLDSLEYPYIGMVLKSLDGQFFPLVKAGVEAEAQEVGAELIVVAPESESDEDDQAELVSIMADMALDVLVVAPSEEDLLTDSLERAKQNGKIILAVDDALDNKNCTALVGSDNRTGGYLEGSFAASVAQGDTAVILRGVQESSNHDLRVSGLKSALESNEIQVSRCINCKSSRTEAERAVQQLLKSSEEVGVICTTNDEMAVGAVKALESAGKDIPVVSFDGTPEVLDLVREGKIAGTAAQDAYQIGADCVDAAVAAFRNGSTEDVLEPVQLITAGNVDAYQEKQNKQIDDSSK